MHPYFTPKFKKFALWPIKNLKQYNSVPVKDTFKLFTPNKGFSGRA